MLFKKLTYTLLACSVLGSYQISYASKSDEGSTSTATISFSFPSLDQYNSRAGKAAYIIFSYLNQWFANPSALNEDELLNVLGAHNLLPADPFFVHGNIRVKTLIMKIANSYRDKNFFSYLFKISMINTPDINAKAHEIDNTSTKQIQSGKIREKFFGLDDIINLIKLFDGLDASDYIKLENEFHK